MEKLLFGNVGLLRAKCPNCGEFDLYDPKQRVWECVCGQRIEVAGQEDVPIERRSQSFFGRRQKIPLRVRREIIEHQKGKCIYCKDDISFETGVHFDHFIPWSWDANDHPSNIVATCPICNHMKSDFIFESVGHASDYLSRTREGR